MKIDITPEQLLHLHSMVSEIYDNVMLGYTLKKKGQIKEDGESASTLREKGYIACGILVRLTESIHREGICTEPDCVENVNKMYEKYFRRELETDRWFAKQFLGNAPQTQQEPVPSATSAQKMRKGDTIRRPESDTP